MDLLDKDKIDTAQDASNMPSDNANDAPNIGVDNNAALEPQITVDNDVLPISREQVEQEYISRLGFSLDEINEFREQKKKNEEDSLRGYKEITELADFIKFSAEKKLFDKSEYDAYEKLNNANPLEVVKAEFVKNYKYSNDELSDDEKIEELEFAFNEQYFLDSEFEGLVELGKDKIQKSYDDLKNSIGVNIDKAKKEYIDNALAIKTVDTHRDVFNNALKNPLVVEFTIGESNHKIELAKTIDINQYNDYIKSDTDKQIAFSTLFRQDEVKAKQLMQLDIDNFTKEKLQNELYSKIYEIGYNNAVEQNKQNRIGATAPFGSTTVTGQDQKTAQSSVEEILRKTNN